MNNTVIDRPENDQAFKSFMDVVKGTQGVSDEETKQPQMYAVILHNDNSTLPDFVVTVLVGAFRIPLHRATQIMYATHLGERNVVCVLPKDVAETRLQDAVAMIRGARKDVDWASFRSPTCELTFTIEPENKE